VPTPGDSDAGEVQRNDFSMRSSVRIAGRHWASEALGSRPSLIAATNSRSISSTPLLETAIPARSIFLSSPS
jgi:hypothetical protein